MEELDRNCFGEPWGDLAGHEQAWGFQNKAFAIWSLNAVAGEAELLRIAVDSSHRGHGLGRALLGACEAEFIRMGISAIPTHLIGEGIRALAVVAHEIRG